MSEVAAVSPLRRRSASLLLGLANVAVLAGCAGSANSERFFALTDGAVVITQADAANASAKQQRSTLSGIVVSAVTIPEIADRPQIVTRDSTDRVIVSEQNLWAESIKSGIARTLASRVSRAFADAGVPVQVGAYPQNSIADPALRITVDVVRFDAVPNGEAVVDVVWSIRRPADDLIRTGRSVASSPIAGTGYDAIVHGWNEALATVEADIATHVLEVGVAPAPPATEPVPTATDVTPPATSPRRARAKPGASGTTR
jgi:uncharacterized lipoprotein YmbA